MLTGTILVTAVGQTTTLHAGDSGSFGKNTQKQTEGGYELVWADEFNEVLQSKHAITGLQARRQVASLLD